MNKNLHIGLIVVLGVGLAVAGYYMFIKDEKGYVVSRKSEGETAGDR